MGLKYGKIVTVTSVKGGTGKTTFTLNLAAALASLGKRVIIVDLDLYSGVIASSLNLTVDKDIYDLTYDLMNNRFDNMDNYITTYNEHIDVLSSPVDPRSSSKIRFNYVDIVISRLKLKYDVILIDTNHIIDKINLVSLDASDYVFYIMTNDLLDIKNMKSMVSIFEDMDMHKQRIVFNEARFNNTSYSKYDIENLIGDKVSYVIPKSFYNHNIEKFVYDGKIMMLDKSFSKSKGGSVLTLIAKDLLR